MQPLYIHIYIYLYICCPRAPSTSTLLCTQRCSLIHGALYITAAPQSCSRMQNIIRSTLHLHVWKLWLPASGTCMHGCKICLRCVEMGQEILYAPHLGGKLHCTCVQQCTFGSAIEALWHQYHATANSINCIIRCVKKPCPLTAAHFLHLPCS